MRIRLPADPGRRRVGAVVDDNRSTILDLAVAAIDDGGEAAVRVNHIVAAAGVTPPVLYYHFGSRDGLVIAAQIERYLRQTRLDLDVIGRAVARCETSGDLRTSLRAIWQGMLTERAENRWRRTNVLGSAYARPELEAAVAAAQDDIVSGLVEIFDPCHRRGWMPAVIDLPSTVAWQHSLLSGRVNIEHGARQGDPAEWDRLTLEALDRTIFGP